MSVGKCEQTKTSRNNGRLTAARIAYWYFRLNGFLNIENFVVHPSDREARKQPGQKTEADLFGVRFPYRREPGMKDDGAFEGIRTKPLFVIAEITKGPCKLNGPWTKPERKNMEYILEAIGAFPLDRQTEVATSLYEHCVYPHGDGKQCEVRFIAVGKERDTDLEKQYPALMQITLVSILEFIYERFKAYRARKKDHSQWDDSGQELWDKFEKAHDSAAFATVILKTV